MKEIILNTRRKTANYHKYKAIIDDEDFRKINKYHWYIAKLGNNFYAQTNIDNKIVLMHKLITGYKETDHIDRNGLNNQRNNLREVTRQQNMMNKRPRLNGSSIYKGVSWHKVMKRWQAQIGFNNKHIYIGYFKSEVNAGQAYNFMAEKLFGEFAKFNHYRSD